MKRSVRTFTFQGLNIFTFTIPIPTICFQRIAMTFPGLEFMILTFSDNWKITTIQKFGVSKLLQKIEKLKVKNAFKKKIYIYISNKCCSF